MSQVRYGWNSWQRLVNPVDCVSLCCSERLYRPLNIYNGGFLPTSIIPPQEGLLINLCLLRCRCSGASNRGHNHWRCLPYKEGHYLRIPDFPCFFTINPHFICQIFSKTNKICFAILHTSCEFRIMTSESAPIHADYL